MASSEGAYGAAATKIHRCIHIGGEHAIKKLVSKDNYGWHLNQGLASVIHKNQGVGPWHHFFVSLHGYACGRITLFTSGKLIQVVPLTMKNPR